MKYARLNLKLGAFLEKEKALFFIWASFNTNWLFNYVKIWIKSLGRNNMERTLVKTAIYSFIISFSLLLIFMQKDKYTTDFDGIGTLVGTSYPDFFFMILRYSIIFAYVMVVIIFFAIRARKEDIHTN